MIYDMPLEQQNLVICKTGASLKKQRHIWKKEAKSIAFVPTMGALHQGHLSLIKHGLNIADKTIVSLFVNPMQFGPKEDCKTYPRPLNQDIDLLNQTGCHCVFIPDPLMLYPKEFSTHIHVKGISEDLEGKTRPSFFTGIATILIKLFNLVQPEYAIFGEKDYQQLCVIKKLVKDLNLEIKILQGKTIRDANGLALSSRNAYLSKEEMNKAIQLNLILQKTAETLKQSTPIQPVLNHAIKTFISAGFSKIDYLELRTEETFLPIINKTLPNPCKARLLIALYLGTTRLIDNWPVHSTS